MAERTPPPASDPSKGGRPQLVSTGDMLAEARRLISEVGVAEFSVRELAKSLGLVPGTIHARFGGKHEMLALLYLQRIRHAREVLDALPPDALESVTALLEATTAHLSTLRREFVLHFEGDGRSQPKLRATTWDALKTSFRELVERLYQLFATAAGNEGVTIVNTTQARRLLWTLSSTMDSQRTGVAFEHADRSYRRFVARSLLAALATD